MSDINGGFNKTAKELQDFVLNQARIADRNRFNSYTGNIISVSGPGENGRIFKVPYKSCESTLNLHGLTKTID